MNEVLGLLDSFLSRGWWQGIAGFAQIGAAILTIMAIRQAQHMIRQAEEARRDATMPHFSMGRETYYVCGEETGIVKRRVEVLNTGVGAAYSLQAAIIAEDAAFCVDSITYGHRIVTGPLSLLPAQDSAEIELWYPDPDVSKGILTITCKTGLGEDFSQRFRISANPNPPKPGADHLTIHPISGS